MAIDGIFNSLFSGGGAAIGGGGAKSKSTGSLLSSLLGFANGGIVRGPGSGTSDSVPAKFSNGEFVINAEATGKHRAMLEAINSGSLKSFASGGLVGAMPISLPSRISATSQTSAPIINLSSNVTVNASGGTPEANADLAQRVTKHVEHSIRGLLQDELQQQFRVGNMLSRSN